MSGKKRAWLRKKVDRLRQLCNKDKPATDPEEVALWVPVVSLSEVPSFPQLTQIRSGNRSSATSPETLPRLLVRPSAGAESVASTTPRLGRMQGPRKPLPEFFDDASETQELTVRKQTSAMSTNTIGWYTPIGDYAGGKQAVLHPTGLLELRRPGSAARIQETQDIADDDFRGKH
jgi:hypothetical protein